MRSFSEIIDVIKKRHNLKKDAEVAALLGFEPKYLATLKSRGSLPYEELTSYCGRFGVDMVGLLSGEGEIGRPGSGSNVEPLDMQLVPVEVYSLAGAGGPMALTEHEPLADRAYVPSKWQRPSVVAVKVRGRSMEPGIMDGAVVGIDIEDRQVISGKVYAVWIDYEGAVIKRLYAEPGRLVLKSDNPEFEPVYITNGGGIVLGKLRWSVQEY